MAIIDSATGTAPSDRLMADLDAFTLRADSRVQRAYLGA